MQVDQSSLLHLSFIEAVLPAPADFQMRQLMDGTATPRGAGFMAAGSRYFPWKPFFIFCDLSSQPHAGLPIWYSVFIHVLTF